MLSQALGSPTPPSTPTQFSNHRLSISSTSTTASIQSSKIKVALRIRPPTRESGRRSREVVQVLPDANNEPFPTSVIVDGKKRFAFDCVFGHDMTQQDVYDGAVKNVVERFLEGYNATVMAYGQTGTGKTFTMGTAPQYAGIGWDPKSVSPNEGIVPRAVKHIFSYFASSHDIENRYGLTVSFIEVYNEDLIDLLSVPPHKGVTIREDMHGSVYTSGAKEFSVETVEEVLELLVQGLEHRQTTSTSLNPSSSRSHAIFSMTLRQQRWIPDGDSGGGDWAIMSSKFHFVDLAGSERLKRTNAVGDRQREGISINSGLLALGNVINALGGEGALRGHVGGSGQHVPYRDSKLTRLLQDGLGGNSQTVMLACISSIESDLGETLNTLKWANRGRNIRNLAIVNHEYSSEVRALKEQVAKLKGEVEKNSEPTDLARLRDENSLLKKQLESLTLVQQRNDYLANELAILQSERDMTREPASPAPSEEATANGNAQQLPHSSLPIPLSAKLPRGRPNSAASLDTLPHSPSPLPDPRVHEYEHTIEELRREMAELKQLNEGAEEYIAGLEAQVEGLKSIEGVVERLEQELETERSGKAQVAEQQSQEHKGAKKGPSRAVNQLWNELLEKEVKAAELMESEEEHKAFKENLMERLKTVQENSPDDANLLEEPPLESDAETLRALLAQSHAEFDTLQSELSTFRSEALAFQQERDGLIIELENRVKGLEGLEYEMETLAKELEQVRREKIEIEGVYSELKEQLDKGQDGSERSKELETELEALRAEEESSNAKVIELSQTVESLCKDLETAQAATEEERAKRLASETAIDALREELELLQREAAELGRGVEDESERVKQLEQVVESLEGEKAGWEKEKVELEGSKEELAQKISDMTTSLEETEERATSLETQLQELQATYDQSVQTMSAENEQNEFIVGELKNKIKDLGEALAGKDRMVVDVGDEVAALNSRCEALESEKAALEQQVEELGQTKKEAEQQLEELTRDLQTVQQDLEAVKIGGENGMEQMMAQITTLQESLDSAARKMGEMEAELIAAQSRHASYEAEKVELGDQITALQSKVGSVTQESAELQNELTNAQSLASGLENEKVELGDQITSLQSNLEAVSQESSQLQKELTNTRSAVSALENEVETLNRQLGLAKETLDAMGLELEQATAQLSASQATVFALQAEKGQREAELEEATTQLSASQATVSALEAEKEQRAGELEKLQGEMESVTRDMEELKSKLSSSESQLSASETDKEQLTAQITELQTSLESANRELDQVNAEFSSARSLHSTSEQDKEELNSQIAALQTSLSSATEELDTVKHALESKSEELQTASSEMESLRSRVETQTGEMASLREELDELETIKAALESKTHELETALSDVVSLRLQVETQTGEMESLREELEAATKRVDEFEWSREVDEDENRRLLAELESVKEELDKVAGEKSGALGELDALKEAMAAVATEREVNQEKDRGELSALQEQLEGLRAEKEVAESTAAQADVVIQELKESVDDLTAQLADLQEKFQQDQNALNHEVQQLRSQMEEVTSEKEHVQSELTERDKLLEELRAELGRANTEVERELAERDMLLKELRAELGNANNELDDARQKVSVAESDNVRVVENLKVVEEEKASLETKLQEVESRVTELGDSEQRADDLGRQVQEIEEEKASLETKFGELEIQLAELETSQKRADDLARQLQEMEESKNHFVARVGELESQLEHLQAQHVDAQNALEALQSTPTERSLPVSDSTPTIEELQDRLRTSEQQREAHLVTILELKSRVAELNAVQEKTAEELSALKIQALEASKVDELNERIRVLASEGDTKIRELEEKIDALEAERDATVRELESANADKGQLEELQQKIGGLETMVKAKEDEVQSKVEEIANANKMRGEANAEIEQALRQKDEEMEAVKQALETAEATCTNLQASYEELQTKLAATVQELEASKHGLDELQATHNQLMQETERLREKVKEAETAESQRNQPAAVDDEEEEGDGLVDLYRKQIAEVVSDRNSLNMEVVELKKSMEKMNDMEKQMEDLRNSVKERDELKEELNALRERIAELEKREAELVAEKERQQKVRGRPPSIRISRDPGDGETIPAHDLVYSDEGEDGVDDGRRARSVTRSLNRSRRRGDTLSPGSPMSAISIIDSMRELADRPTEEGSTEPGSLAERERQELLRMIEILSMHISAADRQLEEDRDTVLRLQAELEEVKANPLNKDPMVTRMRMLEDRVNKQLDEIANMEYELVKARSQTNGAQNKINELEQLLAQSTAREQEASAAAAAMAKTAGRSKFRGTNTFRLTPLEFKEVMPSLLFEELTTKKDGKGNKENGSLGRNGRDRDPAILENGRARAGSSTSQRPGEKWRQGSPLPSKSERLELRPSTSSISPSDSVSRASSPHQQLQHQQLVQQHSQQQQIIGELGQQLSSSKRRVKELQDRIQSLEHENIDSKNSVRQLIDRIRYLEERAALPPPPSEPDIDERERDRGRRARGLSRKRNGSEDSGKRAKSRDPGRPADVKKKKSFWFGRSRDDDSD